jgi:putative copper export protein
MIHLIAQALWLGGIVFFLVVLGPAVQELEPKLAIKTLDRGRTGLETVSWIAIGLLLASGIFNLVVRAQAGTMPGEAWGILLGAKLLLFSAMVVHHSLQVFKYGPVMSRLVAQLPRSVPAWPESLLSQWRRWFLLLKINAALGPIAVLLGLALTKN